MSVFTDPELAYLTGERHLARIGTVGKDGTPHVVPVGWTYNGERDTSTNPWRPRAIEVRGRAEAIKGPEAIIRIYPERIISWGLDGERSARSVIT
jgi:pyridoxamine 5'-phosphate oxidase family protein